MINHCLNCKNVGIAKTNGVKNVRPFMLVFCKLVKGNEGSIFKFGFAGDARSKKGICGVAGNLFEEKQIMIFFIHGTIETENDTGLVLVCHNRGITERVIIEKGKRSKIYETGNQTRLVEADMMEVKIKDSSLTLISEQWTAYQKIAEDFKNGGVGIIL